MMTIRKTRSLPAVCLIFALAAPLTACGEEETEAVPDTLLPTRSEDHLIDAVKPAENVPVETDPTPQATTGGEIPGYEPVDQNEGVEIMDDPMPEEEVPPARVLPDLEDPLPAE